MAHYPLPHKKFETANLKAPTHDKIESNTNNSKFFDMKENIVEKGENAGFQNIVGKGENAAFQHFLHFPQYFQKLVFRGVVKSRDCVVRVKPNENSPNYRSIEFILLNTLLLLHHDIQKV